MGLFHCARSAARFPVSTLRYLMLLRAMLFGLSFASQTWRRLYSFGWVPQIQGASRRTISIMRSMIRCRSAEFGMFFMRSNRASYSVLA